MNEYYNNLTNWFCDAFPGLTSVPDLEYDEFIKSKIVIAKDYGFDPDLELIDESTFPHQLDIIKWACKRGRALIAAAFGLGKSHVQIELAKQIVSRYGGKFLVVCPLGVKHVFADVDGPRLGTEWVYCTSDNEVRNADTPYLITNYERVREGNINPLLHNLSGVSLDEGSVLRSLGSKTYGVFERVFANVPYRFVATATPDPNRYMELIYYSRWLGILDTSFALTQWFKRDTSKAGNLQLIPQHEQSFWMWVASWSLFIYKPSDLGYSDKNYNYPEMRVHWHRLPVDHTRAFEFYDSRGQHRLFLNPTGSSSERAHEKRATLESRLIKTIEIINKNPDEHYVIWHDLEDERRAIEKCIPGVVTVFGSQPLEEKESGILAFERGEYQILATKPSIAGQGCNFQAHCHTAIYMGIDYKFENFFQSLHRLHRFGQRFPVDVHIIYAASEDGVVSALKAKWERYEEKKQIMQAIVEDHGLNAGSIMRNLKRTTGMKHTQRIRGEMFEIIHNDCTSETRAMAKDSIDFIFTSIPFGNHYSYTTSNNDFGHNLTDWEFWHQMDYLIPELYRVLKPGRIALIHIKDRILYSHMTTGFTEVAPFTAQGIFMFTKHGFMYGGQITIVTDVVRENNSTYRLGWSEMCKDGTKMGCGLPEYLLIFRKPPTSTDKQYADEPVVHNKNEYGVGRWQLDASSHWNSSGNVLISPELYDYEAHVEYLNALEEKGNLPKTFLYVPPESHTDGVWTQVNFMQGLNNEQSLRGIENHLCPLPFDIVRRGIERFSNPGDLILDPFCGLGTIPYIAMDFGRGDRSKARRAIGIDISEKYFEWASKYCSDKEREIMAPTLFDYLEDELGIKVW